MTHTRPEPVAGPSDRDTAVLLRRLRRVEGQIAGISRMVEGGRDCAEVITQVTAASKALDRVGFMLVADEMRRCAARGLTAEEANTRLAAAEKLFLRLS